MARSPMVVLPEMPVCAAMTTAAPRSISATRAAAIEAARADERPSIISVKTVIGFGSPNKAGTHGAHGAPLGEDEIALTRETMLQVDRAFNRKSIG